MPVRPILSPITLGNTLATASPNGESIGTININSGEFTFTLQNTGFTDGNKSSYFEYSQIIRDYLDVQFTGTYTSQDLDSVVITFTQQSSTGTVLYSVFETFTGVEGYTYFKEGANVAYSANDMATSSLNLYVPDGVSGYIPEFSGTGFTYYPFITTDTTKNINGRVYKINRVCELKYENYKITFVNKFGAFQDIYFFLVRKDSTNVSSEKYKRHVLTGDGSFNTALHSEATFNVKAKDKLTMNTTFVDESYNDVLSELMTSEKIWITEGSQVLPIRITTTTLDRKTSLNDKLIQYTLNFEYAFDKINNIS